MKILRETGDTEYGGDSQPMPDMPQMPDDAAGSEQDGEIPIPLSALSQPDDQEQMQTPSQGDSVDFTVTAKVSRIDAQMAYVIPQAVNGQPLQQDETEAPDADAMEGDDLRQQAQAMSGGGQ